MLAMRLHPAGRPLVMLDITPSGWERYTAEQVGRAVTYAINRITPVKIQMDSGGLQVLVDLETSGALTVESVLQGVEALLAVDPAPCPCACGADLSIGDCQRDRIELDLNRHERRLVREGDSGGAVVEYVARTHRPAREAADLVVEYRKKFKSYPPAVAVLPEPDDHVTHGQTVQSAAAGGYTVHCSCGVRTYPDELKWRAITANWAGKAF